MKENYNEILQSHSDILTNHLILRKFKGDDAEDIYEYASDEMTVKYLTWNGVSSIEETKELITRFYSQPGVYAIELKDSGKCIGCISLEVIPNHEKCNFGYVLNRNYWNRGYMTEALQAILNFVFDELEINRVEATHYEGNEGSGKVMEKCGLHKEGYAIQEVKIKGVFHDTIHYGITRTQWETRKREKL